jgi:hypothetical protein
VVTDEPTAPAAGRSDLRQYYVGAWRRLREGLPLEPLQAQVAAVVQEHPEYHALIEGEDALTREFRPAVGEANPFLHMGMHLALREQVATDRPKGIRRLRERLAARLGGGHEAEHAMMECLGMALWEAQRTGRFQDEDAYRDCLRRLLTR